MDIAIIYGGDNLLGAEIAKKLIRTGLRVYALGKDFNQVPLESVDFIPVTCDLHNFSHLQTAVNEIISREDNIYALINLVHGEIPSAETWFTGENFRQSWDKFLMAPVYLTRLCLQRLVRHQGYLLNFAGEAPASVASKDPWADLTQSALERFTHALHRMPEARGIKMGTFRLQSGDKAVPQLTRKFSSERLDKISDLVLWFSQNTDSSFYTQGTGVLETGNALPPRVLPRIQSKIEPAKGNVNFGKLPDKPLEKTKRDQSSSYLKSLSQVSFDEDEEEAFEKKVEGNRPIREPEPAEENTDDPETTEAEAEPVSQDSRDRHELSPEEREARRKRQKERKRRRKKNKQHPSEHRESTSPAADREGTDKNSKPQTTPSENQPANPSAPTKEKDSPSTDNPTGQAKRRNRRGKSSASAQAPKRFAPGDAPENVFRPTPKHTTHQPTRASSTPRQESTSGNTSANKTGGEKPSIEKPVAKTPIGTGATATEGSAPKKASPAKKTPTKTAKKVVRKTTAKKTVKKAAAKKATAKKSTTKKTAAKKVPKKTPAKPSE